MKTMKYEQSTNGIRSITILSETKGITKKLEVTDWDMIGWSTWDVTPVYRATITEFSVARGLISKRYQVVNENWQEYKMETYRGFNNGFLYTILTNLEQVTNPSDEG